MTRWQSQQAYILDGKTIIPYRELFNGIGSRIEYVDLANTREATDSIALRFLGREFFSYRIVDLNARHFLEFNGRFPTQLRVD